ncbi:hypothetical protein CMO95_03580 [Candidatus Woesearchaeota archaeon]|nr:hypothetical protein [Candidatus Woesearchaeota archaeon]
MDDILEKYILDSDNPNLNYDMGLSYESNKDYSSAISFLLRCKERTNDHLLQYECLIRCAECFRHRGKSDWIIKDILNTAIELQPRRPEAYFLSSRFHYWRAEWDDSYYYSSFAIENCLDIKPLKTFDEYKGVHDLLMKKALSAFNLNREQEYRDIFKEIFDNHFSILSEDDKKTVIEYIGKFGLTVNTQKHLYYDKSLFENLRYKFSGSEKIDKNYSQSYQDMFILSMLNGKKNGTFLEVGGAYPFYGNNTALLEKEFNWSGITIEINKDHCAQYAQERKQTKVFCDDAKNIDYSELIKLNFDSDVIDYLQLDIEPASNTLEVLKKVPFDECKFAIITYEHDHYVDATKNCRKKSRDYLKSLGYVMVVNDISNDGKSTYEDWWVHPDLIDSKMIEYMKDVDSSIKHVEKYMLPNKFYGEFETDKYIRENYFPDFSYKGTFVDVGAGPPEFISNSKHFRDSGWRTISVEPNPKFVEQHKECDSEVYEYACAGISKRKKTPFIVNLNNDQWYSKENDGVSFSALEVRYDGVPEHNTQEEIQVRTTTLNNILKKAKVKSVDVLSIDTEGWEIDVMKGFDHEKYNPKVIVLENFEDDDSYDTYMSGIGYKRIYTLRYNHFYVKE